MPLVFDIGSWLSALAGELIISLSDATVWRALVAVIPTSVGLWIFGAWLAIRVGLLATNASRGEVLGVGLGTGLLVGASWWAAIVSGGRSSFAPIALSFAVAVILAGRSYGGRGPAGRRRWQSMGSHLRILTAGPRITPALTVLAVVACLWTIGLLYGATMAPSPRDGVQPVEFLDEAFYSVLGRDIGQTGVESIYSPGGFAEVPGIPTQTWYHWGEMWLAAGVTATFGIEPLPTRHYVVLPVLLLAAAALTGTVVRRMTGTSSRRVFLFGAASSVFLSPIPLPGPFFASWARGLVFGITMYGLAAIAVLLILYIIAVHGSRPARPTLTLFSGAAIASVIPTHLVIAILAVVAAGSALLLYWAQTLRRERRLPSVPSAWARLAGTAVFLVVTTVVWGLLTDHGVGTSGLSPSVSPFNESWREAILLTTAGSVAFLAIPIGWMLVRRERSLVPFVLAATMATLAFGAVAWGARLGDFTMFHVFYGGIAVIGTPVAAVAIYLLWRYLRERGRLKLAGAFAIAVAIQLEVGVLAGILRLQQFGPHEYEPIPVATLDAIASLPPDAKIAYACQPFEELAFWNARLISIDAHTGRRVIPMCFQAEFFGTLTGTEMHADIPSPLFGHAPQRELFPTSDTIPSTASVLAFMERHGIEYIYADADHPNILAPNAVQIAVNGETQLLRVP